MRGHAEGFNRLGPSEHDGRSSGYGLRRVLTPGPAQIVSARMTREQEADVPADTRALRLARVTRSTNAGTQADM